MHEKAKELLDREAKVSRPFNELSAEEKTQWAEASIKSGVLDARGRYESARAQEQRSIKREWQELENEK